MKVTHYRCIWSKVTRPRCNGGIVRLCFFVCLTSWLLVWFFEMITLRQKWKKTKIENSIFLYFLRGLTLVGKRKWPFGKIDWLIEHDAGTNPFRIFTFMQIALLSSCGLIKLLVKTSRKLNKNNFITAWYMYKLW